MSIENILKFQTLEGPIKTIVTPNPIELGRLTALTFLKWVSENPNGCISLPTGKTPEYFIKFLQYFQKKWIESGAKDILKLDAFPPTQDLKFVQIDEFYPFDIHHDKSFARYIDDYYLSLLGLDPKNVLQITVSDTGVLKEHGIDKVFPTGKANLDLLKSEPKTEQEKLQQTALKEMLQFCDDYERKIDEFGGIGFFLGGIGYDGHIAFNVRGSSFDSKTRLITLNYESAAQSAGDLGGMENARDKTAITIGLNTITKNKNCLCIVMAAGSEKGRIIKRTLEEKPSSEVPSSILQTIANSRLFITEETSSALEFKVLEKLKNLDKSAIFNQIFDIGCVEKIKIDAITKEIASKYPLGVVLNQIDFEGVKKDAIAHLEQIIKGGLMPEKENILHTNPHHDDDFLSYGCICKSLIEKNENHFLYLTSGFTSVSNKYMISLLDKMRESTWNDKFDYSETYQQVMDRFVKGEDVEAEILAHNIIREYSLGSKEDLCKKVSTLHQYFVKHLAGTKDTSDVQILKGAMRESECDRLWQLYSVALSNVLHLRTSFYTGGTFNPLPKIKEDVVPMIKMIEKTKYPSIITVAFDPPSTGPDTHYKVLQIVGEAVRMCQEDYQPQIWGYRNVWFRFDLSDSDLIAYEVTDEDLKKLNVDFLKCFSTQKSAEFPSWTFDGPFSALSEKIQRDQFNKLSTLLGSDRFNKSTTGIVLIKSMKRTEFLKSVENLKSAFKFE